MRLRIRRFAKDTDGTLSVEAAMILPLLTFFYVASYVWFDAFRVQNTNLKAAYTISDMISRETIPVTEGYMGGLRTVFDYLTYSNHPVYLRVTSIKCTDNCDDDTSRDLEICWSWATTGRTKHTDATFAPIEPSIPLMPKGDTVILTETFMAYEPPFSVGIGAQFFENQIVTRPRFAPEVEYNDGAGGQSCY